MQASYNLVADEFNAVNDLITQQLISDVGLVEDISQYLVASGGKRIRPLVSLLCAAALGDANNPRQIQLATAIEFLHTATLLHDDVVDMSTLRRGKPTANANWGNASSVLVGDFVYSKAFQLMVGIGDLQVMEVLSDTTTKIAEGEVSQLMHIGDLELGESTYFDVIRSKTAQLFDGACRSAAIVAGSDSAMAETLGDYGMHLGLAFQLVDDYLDYAGDSEALGKNVGDDLAEGKLTLPLIDALRLTAAGDSQQHETLSTAIRSKDLGKIDDIIAITRNSGALQLTLDHARQQSALAANKLTALSDSPFKEALQNITQFVLSRTT